MIINNSKYDEKAFHSNDLYFFAIGYEQRSYYLLNKITEMFPESLKVLFIFDDHFKFEHIQTEIEKIENCTNNKVIANYDNGNDVQKVIIENICDIINQKKERLVVHIDYSSMPRNWYSGLPEQLGSILREQDQVFFWYTEGEYPTSYKKYPSAGIESFSLFSGKPSLETEKDRIHIFALSYDSIRTEAIISITDPDYFIACYAYNPERIEFQSSLNEINEHIISRAARIVALRMDDFEFMIAKLCETANELLSLGDVILVPDGPKPLIFAISLVPLILNKTGICCLHVARNKSFFEPLDVKPTGNIYGFSMKIS